MQHACIKKLEMCLARKSFEITNKYLNSNFEIHFYESALVQNFVSSPQCLLIINCLMYSNFMLTDQQKNHTRGKKIKQLIYTE